MLHDDHTAGLSAALQELAQQGVTPDIAESLIASRASARNELDQAVRSAVPAYAESSNPDVLPDLSDHIEQHLHHIIGLLSDSSPSNFSFVREHAERQAQRRFPLEALLHTLRCNHKLISDWVRDAALASAPQTAQVRRVVAAAADFVFGYTDAASTIATAAYVDQTRALAEAEGDQRNELLNTLLDGYDEADPRAAYLLRRNGYLKQRQSYCVVVARSVDASEMENLARAQRMVDAITDALDTAPIRLLIGIRDNHVIAVLSGTLRLSGWTAPQSLLAERVLPHLRMVGPAALIGMSNDVPATSHIPRAVAEARLALDHANVAQRVMQYAELSFQQLLIAQVQAGPQLALPAWAEDFAVADLKSKGALLKTLRAYADANMNVLQTAKALSIHSNTVYARMQKLRALTGQDALNYHALTEMLLVADCME